MKKQLVGVAPRIDFAAYSARGESMRPERVESDAVAIEFFVGRSGRDLQFVVANRSGRVTAESVAAVLSARMSVENADLPAVIKRIRRNQHASGDVFTIGEIFCVFGSGLAL